METETINDVSIGTSTDKKVIFCDVDAAIKCYETCNDADGAISQKFYDWYLGEPRFFLTEGMIKYNIDTQSDNSIVVKFDLSDPDCVIISILSPEMKLITMYHFYREENINMEHPTFDVKYFNDHYFVKNIYNLIPTERSKEGEKSKSVSGLHKDMPRVIGGYIKKHPNASRREVKKYAYSKLLPELIYDYRRNSIYLVYSIMFYFHENPPVVKNQNGEKRAVIEELESRLCVYKYDGFVDLNNKSTTWAKKIHKDGDETRDYTRHIGSWVVRGHYRRVNGKLVWVHPHVKGTGELETRTYGTDKSLRDYVKSKVFYVFRKVKKMKNSQPKKVYVHDEEKPERMTVIGIFKKLFSIFKRA